MIPTTSSDSAPIRPSRASGSAAPTPVPGSLLPRPQAVVRADGAQSPDAQARSLAMAQSVAPSVQGREFEAPRSGDVRRGNLRAHVTRRLAALQAMDASMQAALMRIGQMRQLAMRAAREGVEGAVDNPKTSSSQPDDHETLASVFAQLEQDIELLVEGQLGGYLAANAAERDRDEQPDPGVSDERDDRGATRARKPTTRSAGLGAPRPGPTRGGAPERGGRPAQRVQLQVAAGATPEVGAGPMGVSGDLASRDGAAALMSDLELLARQITGARASVRAAVTRLQRDGSEAEPPPVRTLGARRRTAAESQSATTAPAKARKVQPDDPIEIVRARLALAVSAQANTSPEAAIRLL